MMKCHFHFVDDEFVNFEFINFSLNKRIASSILFRNLAFIQRLK